MVSTASLLGARHLWEVVENKPASSLVVSLGKALNGTPPPLCGRQVAQTPQKWQLPSDCGRPVQNIATQFAFSWMEDKYEQIQYKKNQSSSHSVHLIRFNSVTVLCVILYFGGPVWCAHDLLCCNSCILKCFICRTKTYLKPAGLQWVKTSLIAKKTQKFTKKQGVPRLFKRSVYRLFLKVFKVFGILNPWVAKQLQ